MSFKENKELVLYAIYVISIGIIQLYLLYKIQFVWFPK